MAECRRQQINEDLHTKLLKEFNNKIPCCFGNDNCSCTYFIKNKKITRSDIFKFSIRKMITSIKKDLRDSSMYSQSEINELNQQLIIARDLRNFHVVNDFIKLAENLYESYMIARSSRLEREKKKLKPSDSYSWNQLTRPEKSDWVLMSTLFYNDYLIFTKNETTNKKEEIK